MSTASDRNREQRPRPPHPYSHQPRFGSAQPGPLGAESSRQRLRVPSGAQTEGRLPRDPAGQQGEGTETLVDMRSQAAGTPSRTDTTTSEVTSLNSSSEQQLGFAPRMGGWARPPAGDAAGWQAGWKERTTSLLWNSCSGGDPASQKNSLSSAWTLHKHPLPAPHTKQTPTHGPRHVSI